MTPLPVEEACFTGSKIEEPKHGIAVKMSRHIRRRRQAMYLRNSSSEITDSEGRCLFRARFDFYYAARNVDGKLRR